MPSWFGEKHLITLEDNQLRLTEFNIEPFKPLGKTKTIVNSKIRIRSMGSNILRLERFGELG